MNMRSRGVTVVAGVLLVGLLGLVATVLGNQDIPSNTQLAQTSLPAWTSTYGIQTTAAPAAATPPTSANPKGSSNSKCTANIKDPFTGKMKEVGMECWPSASAGSTQDKCSPRTYIPAGKCKVHYCDISGKNCGIASQDTIPNTTTAPAGTKYDTSWSWETGAKPVSYLNEYQQYLQTQYTGFGSITAGSWGGTGTFGDNPSSSGWQDTVGTAPGQTDAPYIPTTNNNPTLRELNTLAGQQEKYVDDIKGAVDNTFKEPVTYYQSCFDDGAGGQMCVSSLDNLDQQKTIDSSGTRSVGERLTTPNSQEMEAAGLFAAETPSEKATRELREQEAGMNLFAAETKKEEATKWFAEREKGMDLFAATPDKPTTQKPPNQPNNGNPDPNGKNGNNNQGGPPNGQQQGSGSGLGNMLGSMLSGLAKALGGNNNCTPGSQQQQQAYTYQTEITYVQDANGQMIPIQRQVPVAVQQPASSQQCQQQSGQGSGTNANQCSPSYFCTGNDLMYRTNACASQLVQTCQYGCSGVSCIPQGGTGGNNSAQISCSPSTADPGSIIAISFACTNNATSTGVGFDTNGASSGSAQAVTATSSTASNATYTLSCTAGGVTQSSSCTVTLNRPSIMVAATPRSVSSGGIASIGWVSTGMSSCGISSADLPDFTVANKDIHAVSGLATTTALYATSVIDVSCTTLGGGTRTASVTIEVE